MKIASILVALASSVSILLPAGLATASGLERLTIDRTAVGEVVVAYEPRLAKVINKTSIIPEAEIKTVEVLRTRLGDSPDWYRVVYDEGGSVDPEFVIYSETGGEEREVLRHRWMGDAEAGRHGDAVRGPQLCR